MVMAGPRRRPGGPGGLGPKCHPAQRSRLTAWGSFDLGANVCSPRPGPGSLPPSMPVVDWWHVHPGLELHSRLKWDLGLSVVLNYSYLSPLQGESPPAPARQPQEGRGSSELEARIIWGEGETRSVNSQPWELLIYQKVCCKTEVQ